MTYSNQNYGNVKIIQIRKRFKEHKAYNLKEQTEILVLYFNKEDHNEKLASLRESLGENMEIL